MNDFNQASLGDYVSKKMSVWILVLVAAITAAVFAVSFVQSRQMFLKQVASWTAIAPQQLMTNLIDSDHFSIGREVKLLESTGLFSSFCVHDNQKRELASFGVAACSGQSLISVKDDAGIVWGYYSFQSDFYRFISPFVISGAIFLALISMLYLLIRWRIRSNLESEFSRINHFLQNIELLTEKIHGIYQEETEMPADVMIAHNAEQATINRAVARLLGEIRKANKSLKEAISSAEKKRYQDELTEMALQAAHDIGSPLGVLEAAVQSATMSLPENSRITIRNAAAKLRDITYALLKKAKRDILSVSNENISQHLLLCLVSHVVSDKRIEYKQRENVRIEFDYSESSYGIFSMIKAADFGRTLSNLINNAIESLGSSGGNISVKLLHEDGNAVVEIIDNGKGIPPEVLITLGELGMTYGKDQGNGLGLYHAKKTIESWGGKLKIQSVVGHGTVVSVHLLKAQQPAWFVPAIRVMDQQTVVVVDDDESVHQIWESRFKHLQAESGHVINMLQFYAPDELEAWVSTNKVTASNALYLCDHEFVSSQQNGLELIESLKLNILSILVTSRYYLDEMAARCEASNIKLLPKDMAGIIPILPMSLI